MENLKNAPFIGISATLLPIENGSFMGRERAVVGNDYIRAVQLSGGIPILLPVINDANMIRKQMERVDGLLLSGGYDVAPIFYKEEPQIGLEAICPERDLFELELIRLARAECKPILGICRGLQLLNVAFGGTLHQDIGLSVPSVLQHIQRAKPHEACHSVQIGPLTLFAKLMQQEKIFTNTFHHQAIKDLGKGLIVNARSQDGLIEGIEANTETWMLAVQWHPELMIDKHPQMLKLFQGLVDASRRAG